MDDLIRLPEDEALGAFFDDLDRVVLGRLLLLVTALSLIGMVAFFFDGNPAYAVGPAVALVVARVLLAVFHRPFFEHHFRTVLLTYLAVHLIGLRAAAAALTGRMYDGLDLILPLVLVFFFLRRSHMALLLVPLWGVSAGRDLVSAAFLGSEIQVSRMVVGTFICAAVFIWVARQTSKRRQDFLLIWRREHQRHRERHRMQEELDEARRIQLSMLPRSDPSNAYFEIAGISIPASEVGGDYYEYFPSEGSLQTVVVADVAGHGVASGLLLAGVRSCLYLLKDEPQNPAEVLQKLDRVVRETTGRREFVTMLYTVFDPEQHKVFFASTAHPPLLRYEAATGEVHEIPISSLPLGTRLRQPFEQHECPAQPGDIFLLQTDGIGETVNPSGDVYGNERLTHRLKSIAHDRAAKEIRDTLLGDVWSFKADGEQTDDITLVVVKIRKLDEDEV